MRNPAHNSDPRNRQEPDKAFVIDMVRRAVGPKLDVLSQAANEVKEAQRLLELAHWAGDREAEAAIRHALVILAAATQTHD
jgi:hypothetical protein